MKKMRLEGNFKLKNMPLSEIDSTSIEMLLAKQCNSYKAKTLNEYLTIFRATFRRAYSDGIITTNPMVEIENYKVVLPVPDPFTKTEIARLITPSKGFEVEVAFINVGTTTGLRVSELMALTKEAFNKENKTLKIDLALVEGVFKCTKTEGSNRTIRLTEQGFKAMCQLNALAAERKSTSIQITQRDNKAKIKRNMTLLAYCNQERRLYKSVDDFRETFFKSYCELVGVRYRGPSQLRHTFASQMLTAGMPVKWIAKQLGHTSIKMVEKIYGKWIDEDAVDTDLEANRKMNAVLGVKNTVPEKSADPEKGELDLQATILAEVQKTLRLVVENRPKEESTDFASSRSFSRKSRGAISAAKASVCSNWQVAA